MREFYIVVRILILIVRVQYINIVSLRHLIGDNSYFIKHEKKH